MKWIRAKEGHRYTLTALGAEDSRIRAKYEISNPNYSQYQRSVPSSWIDKGYVEEVKDGAE